MDPKEQVKLFGLVVSQLPWDEFTALRDKPSGQVSVTSTLLAGDGPEFITVMA